MRCSRDETLNGFLAQYGYRWLAGFLRGEALQHARRVIEAKYPATQPALVVMAHKRERRAVQKAREA